MRSSPRYRYNPAAPLQRFNPHHKPAGSPGGVGGQFDFADGSDGGELFPGYDEMHRSERFRKWFKDSKVVDENGKPMMVYHATTAEAFDEFNSQGTGIVSWTLGQYETPRVGIFFAEDPAFAATYVGLEDAMPKDGARIIPAFLSIQNPLDLTDNGLSKMLDDGPLVTKFGNAGIDLWGIYRLDNRWEVFDGDDAAQFVSDLKGLGYDGAFMHEPTSDLKGDYSPNTWVAFRPEQVKSVNNRGSFDPADPNFMKFNPNHKPAGSPEGGQFDFADGSGAVTLSEMISAEPGSADPMNGGPLASPRATPGEALYDYSNPPLKIDGVKVGRELLEGYVPATTLISDRPDLYPVKIVLNKEFPTARAHEAIAKGAKDHFYSSGHPNHFIWHELGHAKLANAVPFERYMAIKNSEWGPFEKIMALNVSGYASASPTEFIAESYAAIRSGRKLRSEVMDKYWSLIAGETPSKAVRYSPDQPRVPAGDPDGGQFTFAGGGGPGRYSGPKDDSRYEYEDARQSAKDDRAFVAQRDLTMDEKIAMRLYADTNYNSVNSFLRSGSPGADSRAALLKQIDNLSSAISSERALKPITVWRGLDLTDEEFDAMGLGPGALLADKGFMSTSFDERVGLDRASPVLLRIKVPEGASALYMHPLRSGHWMEREVLFPRDSTIRITGRPQWQSTENSFDGGIWRVDAELVTGGAK